MNMGDENSKGIDDNQDPVELDEQTTEIDQAAADGIISDHTAPESQEPSHEEERQAAEEVREICSEIIKHFPLHKPPKIRTRQDDQTIFVNIEGDGTGLLIGKRGQTLEALQYIVNRIVYRKVNIKKRVEVDTEHYRARRRGQLVAHARRAAEHVRETGDPFYMDPMPASERRVIHLTLKDHPDLFTESEGPSTDRRVIVKPKPRTLQE
jgi:spoIIIJ-associated protein